MFVGYGVRHAPNVFRMLKLSTNKIIHSRDLIWLDQMYGTYKGLTTRAVVTVNNVDDDDTDDDFDATDADAGREELPENDAPVVDPIDDDDDLPAGLIVDDNGEPIPDLIDHDPDAPADDEDEEDETPPPNAKVIREMKKLGGFFNPEAERVVEQSRRQLGTEHGSAMIDLEDIYVDLGLVAADSTDDAEPNNFREAWDHPIPGKRAKWREAIQQGFHDMNRRGVWKKINGPKSQKEEGASNISGLLK